MHAVLCIDRARGPSSGKVSQKVISSSSLGHQLLAALSSPCAGLICEMGQLHQYVPEHPSSPDPVLPTTTLVKGFIFTHVANLSL